MIREQLAYFLPPRFLRKHAFRYLYTFALVTDATLESALQGMSARIPGLGTDTALPRISRDRGIRRGFAEWAADFSARVVTWLTDHKKQGSAFELMRQVQGYLHPLNPRIRLVISKPSLDVSLWRTRNSDGTLETFVSEPLNWDWDGDDDILWARAWLIIYSTPPNEVWTDDGTWDDTATRTWAEDEAVGTWGSTATLEQIQGVRDIVRDWKGAHSLYPEILVCFDDALFDPTDANPPNPDGNWRYYSKIVGGVSVLARAEDTVFWQGTG